MISWRGSFSILEAIVLFGGAYVFAILAFIHFIQTFTVGDPPRFRFLPPFGLALLCSAAVIGLAHQTMTDASFIGFLYFAVLVMGFPAFFVMALTAFAILPGRLKAIRDRSKPPSDRVAAAIIAAVICAVLAAAFALVGIYFLNSHLMEYRYGVA